MDDLNKRLAAAEGLLAFVLMQTGPIRLDKNVVYEGLPDNTEIHINTDDPDFLIVEALHD